MAIEEFLQVYNFVHDETSVITWSQGVVLRIIDTEVSYLGHVLIKKRAPSSSSLEDPLINLTVNDNYSIQV